MTSVKQQFEQAADDLITELEALDPRTLARIIKGLMTHGDGCTRDEAIRMLAECETTLKQLREASKSIGEA